MTSIAIHKDLPLSRAKCAGILSGVHNGGVGPGSYDTPHDDSEWNKPAAECAAAPFLSSSLRFNHVSKGADSPGPGYYTLMDGTPPEFLDEKPSYQFASAAPRVPPFVDNGVPGPGRYSNTDGKRSGSPRINGKLALLRPAPTTPSFPISSGRARQGDDSGSRSMHPGGLHPKHVRGPSFNRYTGRPPASENGDVPGPGWYVAQAPPKRTNHSNGKNRILGGCSDRSTLAKKDNIPGPGTYHVVDTSLMATDELSPSSIPPGRSFSRALRNCCETTEPVTATPKGNRHYRTVPKKVPQTQSSSFASKTSRFRLHPIGPERGVGPIPWSDEGHGYGYGTAGRPTTAPFGSSAARFPAYDGKDEEYDAEDGPASQAMSQTYPHRSIRARWAPLFQQQTTYPTHSAADAHAAAAAAARSDGPLHRDWPKATCTSGAHWGTATRFREKQVPVDGTPGPGTYSASESRQGKLVDNPSWSKTPRFVGGGSTRETNGVPGPNSYFAETNMTLRTFNVSRGAGFYTS